MKLSSLLLRTKPTLVATVILKVISDILTVTFDSSLDDEAGICVSRVVNGKVVVLKMELGEQADILYHLLTEQTTKAEIKSESEDKE